MHTARCAIAEMSGTEIARTGVTDSTALASDRVMGEKWLALHCSKRASDASRIS
jgi:hypothetical protein